MPKRNQELRRHSEKFGPGQENRIRVHQDSGPHQQHIKGHRTNILEPFINHTLYKKKL